MKTRSELVKDAKHLFSLYTTKKPKMSLGESLENLSSASSNSQEAALSICKYLFTSIGLAESDVTVGFEILPELYRIIQAGSADTKHAFMEEVLFNVSHPDHYAKLTDLVQRICTSAQIEELIIQNLESSNELHQFNALSLPYYIYGWGGNLDLSLNGRSSVLKHVAEIRNRANSNSMVGLAARSFSLA